MKKLPTINIKGKEYVQVKDRVSFFNETFPKGSIETEIVKNDDKSVIMKAAVFPVGDPKDGTKRVFTGYSEAYREGNMGDVAIEVAETSAVGRALGLMGIGVIEGIASADEIVKATGSIGSTGFAPKLASPAQQELIMNLAMTADYTITNEQIKKLTITEASKLINQLKNAPIVPRSNAKANAELDEIEDIQGTVDYD